MINNLQKAHFFFNYPPKILHFKKNNIYKEKGRERVKSCIKSNLYY